MKPWLWPVALVLVGFSTALWQQTPAIVAGTAPGKEHTSRLVGAASCAAAACHNGNFAHGPTGSEFTHWMTRDRHAKAYESLFDKPAQEIQARLHATAKAHEDQRCLKCHVHPEYDADVEKQIAYFKTDGVSCESCHGPAKHWLAEHFQPSWKRLSASDKKDRGMNDTQSPLGRAQTCVRCHVGAAGMEVDHDLIAAGHPRLHFELTAFHAQLPRHWPDAKDRDPTVHPRGRRDFEARVWVLGQLATAAASLELLAHRTEEKHVNWPEFAEHDCLACHHQLKPTSWRQKIGYANRKPGALPWGSYIALTRQALTTLDDRGDPDLLKLIAGIQDSFASGKPNRQTIHQNARAAVARLNARLHDLDARMMDGSWVDHLFDTLVNVDGPKATTSWDELTQVQLGLAALHSARYDLKFPIRRFELRTPLLESSKSHLNPRAFEPKSIRHRLELQGDGNRNP